MSETRWLDAARSYRDAAKVVVAARLADSPNDSEQRAAHGFAWIATSVAALEAVTGWLTPSPSPSPLDRAVVRLSIAETIAQLIGGLPMSQNELVRPADLGLREAARRLADDCADLLDADEAANRRLVAQALARSEWPGS